MHTLFENALITQLGTAGRYDAANIGTTTWVNAGAYQNAVFIWQGTGAIGTFNIYKGTNNVGAVARVIGSVTLTAAGTLWAYEVNSNALHVGGTNYAWLTAAGTPAAAGTISGGLICIQFNPRVAPAGTVVSASGLSGLGTTLT